MEEETGIICEINECKNGIVVFGGIEVGELCENILILYSICKSW